MGTWKGASLNAALADSEGNIGFALISQSPIRKNDYPFQGCNIRDGTTSMYDWEGIVTTEKLPFTLNPEKGFYVASNNRVTPENSKYDFGAL
jgi:penicillin amidase